MVVLKPPDCVVVAGRGAPRPTLLDLVKERFGDVAQPVHRLDRPTTGACVFAKSKYGQQALSAAFRSHKIDKRYLCLVEGEPTFDQIDIDARLLRVDDPKARKGPMAWQTIDDANGQRARTQLKVVERAGGHALVIAQPQTGRMHQIRAHLGHVGHPIAGDALYGATNPRPELVQEHLVHHQVGLHALAIAFPRPDGGRSFVIAPVHKGFVACAAAYGLDADKASAPVRESFEARAKAPPPEKIEAKGKRKGDKRSDKGGGAKGAKAKRGPKGPTPSPSAGAGRGGRSRGGGRTRSAPSRRSDRRGR